MRTGYGGTNTIPYLNDVYDCHIVNAFQIFGETKFKIKIFSPKPEKFILDIFWITEDICKRYNYHLIIPFYMWEEILEINKIKDLPLNKDVHEVSIIQIPHITKLPPVNLLKFLLCQEPIIPSAKWQGRLFDIWVLNLRFLRSTRVEFKHLLDVLAMQLDIQYTTDDKRIFKRVNAVLNFYGNNSGYSVEFWNKYIFYTNQEDSYLMKVGRAILWFGKATKIFYLSSDIYIFNRCIKMDLQNWSLVQKNDHEYEQFSKLLLNASKNGFKEHQEYFAILNDDFEELVIRYPTVKAIPPFSRFKVVKWEYTSKYLTSNPMLPMLKKSRVWDIGNHHQKPFNFSHPWTVIFSFFPKYTKEKYAILGEIMRFAKVMARSVHKDLFNSHMNEPNSPKYYVYIKEEFLKTNETLLKEVSLQY